MKDEINEIRQLVAKNKIDEGLEKTLELASGFSSIESKVISIQNDCARTDSRDLAGVEDSNRIRIERSQQVNRILNIVNMIESKGLEQVDSIFLDNEDSQNNVVSIAITISIVGGVAVLAWFFIDVFLVILLVLLVGFLVATFFEDGDSVGDGDAFN